MTSVPSWLPEFVRARLESETSGMLLYGTIGHAAYLRSDGSVWLHAARDWVNDPDTYEWHQASRTERWGALLLGAKRFPELAEMLPLRSSGDSDCSPCHGSGRVVADVLCPTCGGLGWVPEEAA